jgi:excisionase family DNA binding protein
MNTDLLTVKEALQLLHISRATFFRLVKDGVIPVVRLGPRTVRVPGDVVGRLMMAAVEDLKG